MTCGSNEFVGRIRTLRNYFARNAELEPLFVPEAEVAERILAIVEGGEPSGPATALQLLESLDGVPHYNGSGWIDFRMAVHAWARRARGH